MCRWLERDPAGYQDGPSLYSYLGRNPMAGTDPYGLWEERPDDSEGLVRNAVPGRPRPTSVLQPIYDACSDFWGWVWGAEPAAVKLRGGLGAIASLLEIAGGILMIKAGVATTPLGGVGLIGIGAGSVSVLHGLDGLWASLKQLWTGEQQQTYTSQLLTEFIGEENAGIVETVISAVGIVRGIMQIPKWGKGIVDGIRNWRKGRACFLAGTLVLTASPALAAPIESIEAGAAVASIDPATGEATTAIVSATPARLFEGTIYDITVDPGEPGGGDETTVSATGEHPFLVARAGPRAAALDTRADPEAVALVEPLDTRDRTGQDRAGQDRTGHGRWVPASDLDEGDAVRTMSPQGVAGTATVTKIRSRHAVVPVYNLTVQGTSRYLVGACGVVVHNTGCGMGGAEGGRNWRLGDHKTALKWERQMKERGWTAEQITEALETAGIPVRNAVNPANPATRHVHPTTGRSVVIDSQTGQVLQLGGDGFRFSDWDL